ncbi:MAG: hypothetical protein U0414_28000 [Polyangiaceae bacterium]
MIDVIVGNEAWTLDPRRTIGAGGEAVVVQHGRGKQRCAVKLFRDPSEEKRAKLERLLAGAPWPACVVSPTALVLEPRTSRTLGFTMPLLEGGAEPIALLAKTAHRAARGIGRKLLAEILTRFGEALGAIHWAGLVVGDLNDQNELVDERGRVWFIDADSFQIGEHPCTVASELFLDPLLYGPDPAHPCAAPVHRRFESGHDWWSYAVIAFRALTGVHPFGGAHPTLPTVPARARARATVFDPNVQLPAPAREGIASLTRDLRERFEHVFRSDERGAFDLRLLRAYAAEIVRCGCGLELPASRLPCPRCAPAARAVVPSPPSRVSIRELRPAPPRPVPGAAIEGVYALVRGWLFVDGASGSVPVATVVEGQATLSTNARAEGCLVAEQRFGDRLYRFVRRRVVIDLDVPPLDRGERLVDEGLVVGEGVAAVLRITERGGERRARASWFAFSAGAGVSVVERRDIDVPASARPAGECVEGALLVRQSLLVATDHGLVREDLLGRAPPARFDAPPEIVREGTHLSLGAEGLIARTGDRAFALEVLA